MFLVTWGTGSVWADEASEYSAATANITEGTYRIYAVSDGTKYYLKTQNTSGSASEIDFAITTTIFAEASTFTISQSTNGTKKEQTNGWKIQYGNYFFTNPGGGAADKTTFNQGTCLKGHYNNRTDEYDRQVLYYNGTGYAIHACNTTSEYWGGTAYWGLDGSNKACYVAAASKAYIWHFERVVPEGYYRFYGNNQTNQSLSYLLTNADGTALVNSHDGGNDTKDRPYTGSDNKDVWYVCAGAADGTYSIKNVSNNKYIQINSHNTKDCQSQALNASTQDVCFTDYYQYIGANSTDTYRFINLNKAKVNVWSGPDANNKFTLYPMSAYALTIVGQTSATVTVSSYDHNSAATTGNVVYIDNRATSYTNLSVSATVGGVNATATITGFNTTKKTIEVTVGDYSRTFATAGQKYTVCLPFALNSEQVAEISGKFYELSSYENENLKFTEVESTTIYKPYIFVPSANNVTIIGTLTTYNSSTHGNLTTSVSGNAASFVGTMAPQALVSGEGNTYYGYSQSSGNFVQVGTGTGANIGAFRAYICIPGVSEVKSFNVKFEDSETTGIEMVNGAGFKATGSEAYDLQGRRVSNPIRGLYIINGKKAVIK